jgi:hypothetical protein
MAIFATNKSAAWNSVASVQFRVRTVLSVEAWRRVYGRNLSTEERTEARGVILDLEACVERMILAIQFDGLRPSALNRSELSEAVLRRWQHLRPRPPPVEEPKTRRSSRPRVESSERSKKLLRKVA